MIKDIKFQVHQMVSVPNFNEVVLVDSNENLWRFSLNNFNLSDPHDLRKSISLFKNLEKFTKKEASRVVLGKINSLVNIPQTDYLIMALGSYFKGGAGILITKLNNDSISHRFFSEFNVGILNLYVPVKINFPLNSKQIKP